MSAVAGARQLSVQDAWRTMADGMTIHRWFLSADDDLTALLASRRERAACPDTVCGESSGWSRGALLQLLHPDQKDAGLRDRLLATGPRYRGRPAMVGGGRWLPTGELLVLLPAMADAGPPSDAVRQAVGLVAAAGLGSLFQVAADLLVTVAERPSPRTSWRAGGACLPVFPDCSVPDIAAQLAVGMSLQVLRGFVAYYGTADHAAAVVPDPDGLPVAAEDLAAELLAVAVANRVLETAALEPARWSAHAADLSVPLDASRAAIERLAPVVYSLDRVVERTCFEYVNVSFPGPRQFEKYEAGSGVGQG